MTTVVQDVGVGIANYIDLTTRGTGPETHMQLF